jgi:hypothetical protein
MRKANYPGINLCYNILMASPDLLIHPFIRNNKMNKIWSLFYLYYHKKSLEKFRKRNLDLNENLNLQYICQVLDLLLI